MSSETKKTDEIIDSITQPNIKSLGEQPAMLSNLAYANLIANQSLSEQNAVSQAQTAQAQTAPLALTEAQIAATVTDLKAPQPPIQPQSPAETEQELARLRIEIEKLKKK